MHSSEESISPVGRLTKMAAALLGYLAISAGARVVNKEYKGSEVATSAYQM